LLKIPGCETLKLGLPNGNGRCILERSAHNEGLLWAFLTLLLRILSRTTEKLSEFRGLCRLEDTDRLEAGLAAFNSALHTLHDAVSRSGSIWRLLRNPAILNAIKVRCNTSYRRGIDPVRRPATPVQKSITLLARMQTRRILARLTHSPIWMQSETGCSS
jgi:hypothetical protein